MVPSADTLEFGTVAIGDSATRSLSIRNDSGAGVTVRELVSSDAAFVARHAVPIEVAPGGSVSVAVSYLPNHPISSTATLYVTSANDTELVSAPVVLRGSGTGTATVGGAGSPAFELREIAPVPCRGTARIGFSVPAAARVRLSILDVQGRVVSLLADGRYGPGRHELPWHCGGRDVPAGLYFVRYEWPGGGAMRRLAC